MAVTDLSQQIRDRRAELRLSQQQLAQIVGVSRGTIRNVEAGKPMEASTRRGIERALGWRPDTTDPLLARDDALTITHVLLVRVLCEQAVSGADAGWVSPDVGAFAASALAALAALDEVED
jgi:transcriptional regulator with XRE-family HTH domain